VEGPATFVDFDAVVGFVDLSGFTTASERLGRFGPRGTEQLQALINSLFTPIIDIVHHSGGEIGWFAGDAVGVVFDTETTPPERALDALVRASHHVSKAAPFDTDDGPIRIGIKIGIGSGPARWSLIGDAPVVWWFGGPAIDAASDAEGFAEPGDVIVPTELAERLDLRGTPDVGVGFCRIEVAASADEQPAISRDRFARLSDPDLQPPRVARLARAGEAEFLAEHRPVSSVFVKLPDDRHDPVQLAALVEIVQRHGGFAHVTEGDKGALAFAQFGAPTALADRHELAVRAAHEIRGLSPECHIGVTAGRVYAGQIGSPARWDYTVLGDRVNTAARLMTAAESGEILIDESTAAALGDAATLGNPRELLLKGKSELERAHPVVDVRAARRAVQSGSSTFVGRRAEVEELTSLMSSAGLTLVTGTAGTGKSRLLAHVVDQLADVPPVISIDPTDRIVPFGLWPRLFAALIGATPTTARAALDAAIDDDARLPLLSPLLDHAVPDSTFTAALSADDRSALMLEFLDVVLDAAAIATPVVIEDLHWADDASLELLARVAGRLQRSVIVATARPTDEVEPLDTSQAVRSLALAPIDADAMSELASATWLAQLGSEPVAELVVDIVERAGGSPLFCEQLITFARTNGAAPTATELPGDIGIPDNLTDLLLVQLDALPEAAMTAASLGATFGQRFTADELVGAFGHRYVSTRIVGGLEILRDRGVISGLNQLRFVHSLFGETTYDRMSLALRADLHLDVVLHVEAGHADDLEPVASVLAHHVEATSDAERKRRYFRMAADQATRQWASAAAVHWFEGLIPLLDGGERGSVSLELGRIKTVSGDASEAEQHFIDAIKDVDPAHLATAELGLARVLMNQGSTGAAFELIDSTIERAHTDGRWADLHAAMESKADFSTLLGDIQRAEQVESLHAELVQEHGPDHPASNEITALVPLLWLRGDLDAAAIDYERLYHDAVANDDLVRAAKLGSDLAGLAYESRRLDGVFSWLDQSRALTARTGDRRNRALVDSNESALRFELGDQEGALRLSQSALNEAIALDDPRTIVVALYHHVKAANQMEVEPAIRRGLALAQAVGDEMHKLAFALQLAGVWASLSNRRWVSVVTALFQQPMRLPDLGLHRLRLVIGEIGYEIAGVADAIEDVDESASTAAQAEVLAVRARMGVDPELRVRAIAACAREYGRFPSENLALQLEGLGHAVTRPALPPAVAIGGDRNRSDVIELLDRRPELLDWAQVSDRVIEILVTPTDS
jgi:class 3 adenylate cyclase/tetratricopeptide (TPR) repeat protein